MERPTIIDLYCGEGGAAVGYHEAGWQVIGIDIVPQPRFPFPFLQADCLSDVVRALLPFVQAAHASPPCQFGSEVTPDKSKHLNLIPPTRAMLQASGLPYVIENVRAVREHLINPVSLFGTMFDLHMRTAAGARFDLSRERLFETNWPLTPPVDFPARFPIANVFGGHLRVRSGQYRTGNGTGRTMDLPGEDRPALARQLMGMPWATMKGISEAVPPAYTRHIGAQLLAHIRG